MNRRNRSLIRQQSVSRSDSGFQEQAATPGRRPAYLIAGAMALAGNMALAAPFGTFDPRSMAMGGTGVASGTGANASFYNPALLANEQKWHIEFPVVGLRAADPDELLSELEKFQNDGELTTLESAVSAFNNNPGFEEKEAVISGMRKANARVETFSGKPLEGDFFAGSVVAIPGNGSGMALHISGSAAGSGQLVYKDAETVNDLTRELDEIFDIQAALRDAISANDNEAAASALRELDSFISRSQFVNASTINDDIVISLNEDATKPRSEILTRAIASAEIGFSYARSFDFGSGKLAIGITPKFQKITTVDFKADVDTDPDTIAIENYREDSSSFNLDIGVSKHYNNGVTTGIVAKNLVSQRFRTANVTGRGDIEQKPQLRFGAAHAKNWNPAIGTTVALDVDITENEVAFDGKSRQLGVGAELDFYSTVQLRMGYRTDLGAENHADTLTAGLGISPFGMHIDLAISASANLEQAYGGIQFGLRY